MLRHLITILCLFCFLPSARSEELLCKVQVIHSHIQGTNTSLFTTLETALNEFMNTRSWTDLQFQKDERIECTMNITVNKYDESKNLFSAEILLQSARPIFNSTYNSTVFSIKDPSFEFVYKEFDQLEWNENNIDNNLTAVMAYYAYLIIGMDLDTFSPLGGTQILQTAENIVNNAQTLSEPGWAAFKDTKNRHAIINDYLESSMEPFRQMQYKYYRQGLDEMANNADRGRTAITEAIELLDEAHHNNPLSMLPQLFTEYKRDEIVSIYTGHGTEKERQTVKTICSNINASMNSYWNKIK